MIWLIGSKGMLGSEIAKQLSDNKIDFIGTDQDVDITNLESLVNFAEGKNIEWIINCAAYTAVDKAEDDIPLAKRLNVNGPRNIAQTAKKIGAVLIHVSTDYVFSGMSDKPFTGRNTDTSRKRYNNVDNFEKEGFDSRKKRSFGKKTDDFKPRREDGGSRKFSDKRIENTAFEKRATKSDKVFRRRDVERDADGNFAKPVKRDADYNPHAKYSLKKQIEYKKKNLRSETSIRLNRFLANAGICSRREADDYIKAGVVSVNGEIVTEMGTKVSMQDKVLFHDQPVKSEKKIYILINKPKDCVTTSEDPQERFTVMDLIKNACQERVYPVGRLDRNTTGVLLLTNDGDLAARLTHPKYNKKKIYHVHLDKPLTKADMESIAKGIVLEDGEIHADSISFVDETDKRQVGIEIHSGRNRIVRRIFEHFGYKVEKLDRVYFAGLTKKNLPRGKYRFLTEKELAMLNMGAYE